MAALRTKYQVMAAKIEGTPGTAESLASADGAENFFTSDVNNEVDMAEREQQGTFSPISQIPGSARSKVSTSTHLYNSGNATAPFWASTLLVAAGFSCGTTSTYKPSIAVATTLTMGHYVDGALWLASGVMLDLTISADKVGAPIVCKWEGAGNFHVPTATSIITPTYPTVNPPGLKAATLTLGSISPFVVSKFGMKIGNRLTQREDASQTYGVATTTIITDRKPRFSLTVEVPPVGSHEYYADLFAGTTAAFSLAVGSGSNGIVTIAAPKLQLVGSPKRVDLNGVLGYELEYMPLRNTAAGDDELSIALS